MKKIHANNWLAKIVLAFSSCHTIMLFGFVLSKKPAENYSEI